MTGKSLEQFKSLTEEFQNDCKKYCKILSKYDRQYSFMKNFSLDVEGNLVECDGCRYYGGEIQEYYRCFPATQLTLTEREMQEHCDQLIAQRYHEEQLKKMRKLQAEQERRERLEKSEYQTYLRLKEKYENQKS